jgi:hypothetical protein
VLDKVKVNGGVVMVTFVAGFVSQKVANITQPAMARYKERIKNVTDTKEQDRIRKEIMDPLVLPKVTVGQVADHIEYIKKRIGVAQRRHRRRLRRQRQVARGAERRVDVPEPVRRVDPARLDRRAARAARREERAARAARR